MLIRDSVGQESHGQAMVEFAFTFSIFVLLFIGFIGTAMVYFSWLTTAAAAREGARYIVENPTASTSQIIDQVCRTTPGLGGSEASCKTRANARDGIVITPEPSNPDWRLPNTQISVIIEYRTPVPTLRATFLNGSGITFLGPISVTSTAVMQIE